MQNEINNENEIRVFMFAIITDTFVHMQNEIKPQKIAKLYYCKLVTVRNESYIVAGIQCVNYVLWSKIIIT